uniref:Uncharacterized protein n=1 Tax=Arundo donax TaxID=35708 RepID=A0A0A8ZSR1_ARUDO
MLHLLFLGLFWHCLCLCPQDCR